jgi:hypothetical protein
MKVLERKFVLKSIDYFGDIYESGKISLCAVGIQALWDIPLAKCIWLSIHTHPSPNRYAVEIEDNPLGKAFKTLNVLSKYGKIQYGKILEAVSEEFTDKLFAKLQKINKRLYVELQYEV